MLFSILLTFFTALHAQWTCIPGISTPVRLNENGNVECMSLNHHDCLWGSSEDHCVTKLNTDPNIIQPLMCGAMHLQEWGSTGYDNENHWCFKSYEFLSPWQCISGLTTPIRRNPVGDIECMSLNHHDCLWSGTCQTKLITDPNNVRPLACGAKHKVEWGGTGYDNPTHWCTKGYEYFNTWKCVPGQTSPMRLNIDGNPECMSLNHHDCLWGNGNCQSKILTDPAIIKPLTCGTHHKNEYGITGYEQTSHWCFISKEYFTTPNGYTSRNPKEDIEDTPLNYQPSSSAWQCILGFSTPIRLNSQGDVECMSTNHHDCLWAGDCTAKLSTNPQTIQPLVCGENHKREWGLTGYDNPHHWCSVSAEYLKSWRVNNLSPFYLLGIILLVSCFIVFIPLAIISCASKILHI